MDYWKSFYRRKRVKEQDKMDDLFENYYSVTIARNVNKKSFYSRIVYDIFVATLILEFE